MDANYLPIREMAQGARPFGGSSLGRLFYFSLFVAFLNVHTPVTKLRLWYEGFVGYVSNHGIAVPSAVEFLRSSQSQIFLNLIVPLKNFSFLLCLFPLIIPLVQSIRSLPTSDAQRIFNKKILVTTMKAFFFLSLLAFPFHLGIMGLGYAYMSVDFFGFPDNSGLLYKRVLMPALAHYLQFSGPTYFHIFSMVISFVLIYMTAVFFSVRKVSLPTTYLVSIGTASFILSGFQSAGYPEQLLFVLLLLLFCVPMDETARISIVSLSLLSHEASVFILLPIAFFCFSRREFIQTVVISVGYFILWLASYGFDVSSALAPHNMGGESGIWWLVRSPVLELLGIFLSFKILWLYFFIALIWAKKNFTFPLVVVGMGVLMTFLGVDTTRMMGFAFIGLLFALLIVMNEHKITQSRLRLLMVLNILIPSAYVGLNAGILIFAGLYRLAYVGTLVR
jgi:hypothetical protein